MQILLRPFVEIKLCVLITSQVCECISGGCLCYMKSNRIFLSRWYFKDLPEIDWQPLVFPEHLSVWEVPGWCRYTPGENALSHCPTPLFQQTAHDFPSGRCKTLPCTNKISFSEIPSPHLKKNPDLAHFYLKYWLAAASMALWQGKSCPSTLRITSVSSLFTRKVSIPLWSSTGRPPSSQRTSLAPAGFSLSSFVLDSSPRSGKGQSVVFSSESLIVSTRGSSETLSPQRQSMQLLFVHLHA